MPEAQLPADLVLAHRSIGYLTAFVVAPLALLAFARRERHRALGQTFAVLMIVLYASGLYFTFERHAAGSFVWARNLAFNFIGFHFLLLGWRSAWRWRQGAAEARWLDHVMRAMLAAASGALVALGSGHHFPSFVFGLLGLYFAAVELRERSERQALFRRHQRCMLGAFFYVLTVLSLVHVPVRGDLKWLWPLLIGVPLAIYATHAGASPGHVRRAVWATLGVTAALGICILAAGGGLSPAQR